MSSALVVFHGVSALVVWEIQDNLTACMVPALLSYFFSQDFLKLWQGIWPCMLPLVVKVGGKQW